MHTAGSLSTFRTLLLDFGPWTEKTRDPGQGGGEKHLCGQTQTQTRGPQPVHQGTGQKPGDQVTGGVSGEGPGQMLQGPGIGETPPMTDTKKVWPKPEAATAKKAKKASRGLVLRNVGITARLREVR